MITETANQILNRVVPVCTWQVPGSTNSTGPAYPRFPGVVREWRDFGLDVILNRHFPGGQFPAFPTNTEDLHVEEDAKFRFYSNVISPVVPLLGGALFKHRCIGMLGVSDFILCTNNPPVGLMPMMPVEVYKKDLISGVWRNGLQWPSLRDLDNINPTLRECVFHISHLAINDTVGNRLDCVLVNINDTIGNRLDHMMDDNFTSYDDDDDEDDDNDDDPDYDPDDDYIPPGSSSSKKRKSSSIQTGSKKRVTALSSKGITTIGKYIGSGTFGKVFSGYYDGQSVAWKTCDVYKEQKATKMLEHEAHIYSILKECQSHAVPRLLYKGYIYDGYLFALVLQLIEGAHHVDPERPTKEEKK
ncbi:hypothetical protein RhiirA5_496001 [Rhizophagus irregularis]|uniref:Protein kinase domain-containing protein n=1 Tax=Rhizophagus irregularis TaxID=588596 RepID=A0A2N0Q3P5_9GLOM|nr:hypothetical protein RhiirA5_496001 [Rhizophagus irregularis]